MEKAKKTPRGIVAIPTGKVFKFLQAAEIKTLTAVKEEFGYPNSTIVRYKKIYGQKALETSVAAVADEIGISEAAVQRYIELYRADVAKAQEALENPKETIQRWLEGSLTQAGARKRLGGLTEVQFQRALIQHGIFARQAFRLPEEITGNIRAHLAAAGAKTDAIF